MKINPLTIGINGMRDALLGGTGWSHVPGDMAILLPLGAAALLAGNLAFRIGVKRERSAGRWVCTEIRRRHCTTKRPVYCSILEDGRCLSACGNEEDRGAQSRHQRCSTRRRARPSTSCTARS